MPLAKADAKRILAGFLVLIAAIAVTLATGFFPAIQRSIKCNAISSAPTSINHYGYPFSWITVYHYACIQRLLYNFALFAFDAALWFSAMLLGWMLQAFLRKTRKARG